MEVRLDFKNKVTKIKLKKSELGNGRMMDLLISNGAKFERETSKFVWYTGPVSMMMIF